MPKRRPVIFKDKLQSNKSDNELTRLVTAGVIANLK